MDHDEERYDHKLPQRLFRAGEVPLNSTMHIYTKIDCLSTIFDRLTNTPEMDLLRHSCFGKLFDLPVSRCPNSGKLIHNLLCRQLATDKKHEMWFVFGGKPFRFSLREFGIISGLPCGKFPNATLYKDAKDSGKPSYWSKLFGENVNLTIYDLLEMLIQESDMPGWKKFKIALLIIVDGIIVCNSQFGRITPQYVEWLSDMEFFLSYPWGRESFNATISRMTIGPKKKGKSINPYNTLKQLLTQKTSACYGFPLALQLIAFQSIPSLQKKLRDHEDVRSFMERTYDFGKNSIIIHQKDIIECEMDPNLIVHPFIDGNDLTATYDYTWDDDIQDPKIDYLEQLLKDGHNFHSEEWSTLNTSMPCIDLVRKHEKEKATQSTVSRSPWQPKNTCTGPHIAQIDSTTEQRVSAMIDDLKEWVGLQMKEMKLYISKEIHKYSNLNDLEKTTFVDDFNNKNDANDATYYQRNPYEQEEQVEFGDECQHDYAHLKDKDKPPLSEEIQGVADEARIFNKEMSHDQDATIVNATLSHENNEEQLLHNPLEKCSQVDTSQLLFKDTAPFLEANKTQAEEEPQDLPCEVSSVVKEKDVPPERTRRVRLRSDQISSPFTAEGRHKSLYADLPHRKVGVNVVGNLAKKAAKTNVGKRKKTTVETTTRRSTRRKKTEADTKSKKKDTIDEDTISVPTDETLKEAAIRQLENADINKVTLADIFNNLVMEFNVDLLSKKKFVNNIITKELVKRAEEEDSD